MFLRKNNITTPEHINTSADDFPFSWMYSEKRSKSFDIKLSAPKLFCPNFPPSPNNMLKKGAIKTKEKTENKAVNIFSNILKATFKR